ncbi:MAG: hypothetical protein ACK5TO_05115 [Planctomycetaceae bacterium]|jgi:hypothetical protein
MDQTILVNETIEAGERLLREFHKAFPITAAFWRKDEVSAEWYLYLCSEQIHDGNFGAAYGEVLRIMRPGQERWFDPFHVKVLGTTSPLARSALAFLNRSGAESETCSRKSGFFVMGGDEVFFYTTPAPAAVVCP